jgi:E3 ubiquitin-protein ligase synoviolin
MLYIAICFGVGFKNVFFGELRPIEYEVGPAHWADDNELTKQHLFERLWIFLTESLFALTIFR